MTLNPAPTPIPSRLRYDPGRAAVDDPGRAAVAATHHTGGYAVRLVHRYSRLALLLALSISWACAGDEPVQPGERYEVRGIVRQLPKGPKQELYIHHEAIPHFVGIDGEIQPMDAMAMPFPVEAAALPDDLKAGDKVTFEFEVSWQGSPPLRLLTLEKLPPETVLAFEMSDSEQTMDHGSHGDHGNHGDHGEAGHEAHGDGAPEAESHGAHGMDHLGDEEHGGLGHGGGDQNADDAPSAQNTKGGAH